MVASSTFMEPSWPCENGVEVTSGVFGGGNKGDVSSGLGRAVGGSCWRLYSGAN